VIRTSAIGLAVALGVALAGCGSSGTQPGGFTYENTLTIYSGLPLQGTQAALMQSIVNGEILALRQADGRAHGRPISFAAVNDSPLANGTWDGKEPRAAGQDLDAIAYIGDYSSAATAISLPILNENDILQVSPGSPYLGFTDASPFTDPVDPAHFFPSGHDTFARLVPSDLAEARAEIEFMRAEGVRRLYVLTDSAPASSPYESAIGAMVVHEARLHGIELAGSASFDSAARSSRRSLLAAITRASADGVFVAAAPSAGVEALWTALHAALPALRLFAPSTLATHAFLAATSASAAASYVTSPILPLTQYPSSARAVLRAYRKTFGSAPTALSLYGYEAMSSILAAIAKARNPADRLDVLAAYRSLGWRDSVIGRYEITASGDSTMTRFAGYGVGTGGKLTELRLLNG
jgi:ABC-type branched-subunit amino acid transport system substrate-binding protein